MRISNNDQQLLAEAYKIVQINEALSEDIKNKITAFVDKNGAFIANILQKKFPNFVQKLKQTNGDYNAVQNLVKSTVGASAPVQQEGFFGDAVGAGKQMLNKITSINSLNEALLFLGKAAMGMGAIQGMMDFAAGQKVDYDLIYMGLALMLTHLMTKFLTKDSEQQM